MRLIALSLVVLILLAALACSTPPPTPTPGIEEGVACTLADGEVVEKGWSGKNTGSNSCNQCRCLSAGLACTKMACPMESLPTILTPTPIRDAEFYFNKGESYYNLGEYQRAIEAYGESIHRDPQDANAYHNRGHSYDNLGNTAQADRDYAKAKELGHIE